MILRPWEYSVVTEENPHNLGAVISEKLKQGWKLVGGVSVTHWYHNTHPSGDRSQYAQAIKRRSIGGQ